MGGITEAIDKWLREWGNIVTMSRVISRGVIVLAIVITIITPIANTGFAYYLHLRLRTIEARQTSVETALDQSATVTREAILAQSHANSLKLDALLASSRCAPAGLCLCPVCPRADAVE